MNENDYLRLAKQGLETVAQHLEEVSTADNSDAASAVSEALELVEELAKACSRKTARVVVYVAVEVPVYVAYSGGLDEHDIIEAAAEYVTRQGYFSHSEFASVDFVDTEVDNDDDSIEPEYADTEVNQ